MFPLSVCIIYTTCNTVEQISLTQVPSKYDAILCFAPAVPDGYGCCYNPMPNQINYCVSAWNSSPETSALKYGKAVEQALTDAHDLLLRTQNMSKL